MSACSAAGPRFVSNCSECGGTHWPNKKMKPCCEMAKADAVGAAGILKYGNEISPNWGFNITTRQIAISHIRYCHAEAKP